MCDRHNEIWVNSLKKIKLTVLSQKLCSKFGVIEEHNDLEMVVNPRKELCGAFINKLDVAFVNYTKKTQKEK